MRTVLVVAALAACSQRTAPDDVEIGAFDPRSTLHDGSDALRVSVHRKDVPLQDMPVVAEIMGGLPMSGLADLAIDLAVPKTGGVAQLKQATGSIAFACADGCKLGDDRAKLTVHGLGPIDFGHLAIASIDARVDVKDGRADLSRWALTSNDLTLYARLRITFADNLEDSMLEGCIRFRPELALAARDPKTAAVLDTTGASKDAEGFFTIRVGGTIGDRKYLAQACQVGA